MRTTQILVIVIAFMAIVGLCQKHEPTQMNMVTPPTTSQPAPQPSSGIGEALSITK